MTYSKEDIARKLRDYPSLIRQQRQLEFELALLSENALNPKNGDARNILEELLMPVSTELRRLECYIGLLPEKDSAVLRLLFLEGLTNKETAAKLMIDEKTVVKRKDRGLDELAAMYSRLPVK